MALAAVACEKQKIGSKGWVRERIRHQTPLYEKPRGHVNPNLSCPSLMQHKGAFAWPSTEERGVGSPLAVTDKREKLKWNKKRWKKAVNRMAWLVSRERDKEKAVKSRSHLMNQSLSLKKKKWLSVSLHYVLILTNEF